MKTIGLIGGMSWESTQTYYRLVNQHVRTALGGLHSARVVLYSADFAEIEALQHQGNWQATAEILAAAVSIPLLHIADATAQVLQRQGEGLGDVEVLPDAPPDEGYVGRSI